MEETKYKNNEKVLFKAKGKLILPDKETEDADCFITEKYKVIEDNKAIRIPVSRVKMCDIENVTPSYFYPIGKAELTFIDDLNKKHKLTLKLSAKDLLHFKQELYEHAEFPGEGYINVAIPFIVGNLLFLAILSVLLFITVNMYGDMGETYYDVYGEVYYEFPTGLDMLQLSGAFIVIPLFIIIGMSLFWVWLRLRKGSGFTGIESFINALLPFIGIASIPLPWGIYSHQTEDIQILNTNYVIAVLIGMTIITASLSFISIRRKVRTV